MNSHPTFDIVGSSFEKIAHLEIRFSGLQFGFDIAIGVVNDGQEHVLLINFNYIVHIFQENDKWLNYQQDEENEEDVRQKVDWSKNRICLFNVSKVEISKNHPEQSVNRINEGSEIAHL